MFKRCVIVGAFAIASVGCTSYTSISRHDGTIYLTGNDTYIGVFNFPWIKKCRDEGKKLVCKKVEVDVIVKLISSQPNVGPNAAPTPPPPKNNVD